MPNQPPNLYTGLPREELRGVIHRINRPFNPGNFPNARTVDRFRNWFPGKIVLYFAKDFFNVIKDCSNTDPSANFTHREIYAYFALLC
jgi:hypothetical protein